MTGLGFAGIEYMQEMDQVTCYRAAEGEQGRLEDIRDGKVYWVGKLKDGNCWMTQNLDLDLKTNKPLTSADSDVGNWTPSEATQTSATPNFGTTNNNIKSWDPAQGGAEKYCTNGKCNNTSTTSSNNRHDAQGNYYSWGAATAGQASSISTAGQDATQSICPKGWQLPTSNSTTASKSFGYLLNGLSVATITTDPYYFVYGGSVLNSSLNYAGNQGLYWSSTARDASIAYVLSFSTSVTPSNTSYRYVGYSVRCVAR